MANEEELIQLLSASFPLVVTQVNEPGGKGYRLNLSVQWRNSLPNVTFFQVQLCGIDPISGDDVADHEIIKKFDFMITRHSTDVLTYHGSFYFSCTAFLNDGRSITFKKHPIQLNYPQNQPYIQCAVTSKGDFKLVRLESNCWSSCAEKVWVKFDGHLQRVMLPVRNDKTVQFYVPATTNVDVQVQDSQVQIK